MRNRHASSPGLDRTGRIARLATLLAVLATPAIAAQPRLEVQDPWLRYLPANRPAAGYFTLHNAGGQPVDLVGASSPACASLMLHESSETGGMAQMKDVGSVPVPAGGSISFSPGSYHLMCMELDPKVKPGGTVPVTLRFRDGTAVTARFPVRGPRGE